MDRSRQGRSRPTPRPTYQRQFDLGDDLYGDRGRQLQDDALSYVAGINQYIAEARLDPNKMPAEYVAIGRPQDPELEGDRPVPPPGWSGGSSARAAAGELERPSCSSASREVRLEEGPHPVGAASRLRRPRRADDRAQGTRFPYQTSPSTREGRRGAARPGLVQGARGLALVRRRPRRAAAAGGQPAAAGAPSCRAPSCRAPPRRRCPAAGLPELARCPRRSPTRCWSRGATRPAVTRSRSSARRWPTSPRRS